MTDELQDPPATPTAARGSQGPDWFSVLVACVAGYVGTLLAAALFPIAIGLYRAATSGDEVLPANDQQLGFYALAMLYGAATAAIAGLVPFGCAAALQLVPRLRTRGAEVMGLAGATTGILSTALWFGANDQPSFAVFLAAAAAMGFAGAWLAVWLLGRFT